jgi:putative ABC transport system permease protein
LNPHTFHITLYDLAFLGTIFIGLNFALLLGFAKNINQSANRFLALALIIIVLWMTRILGVDVHLSAYIPHWSWLPLQFSLALGPLIYFYVLKLTWPEYKFRGKDMLHFSPLLLEVGAEVLEVRQSAGTGAATYNTPLFQQVNPVLQLLAFVSVGSYLYLSTRLIERFYQRLKFNGGDRYRYQWRWLRNLLTVFGGLWLLWIPCVSADYFYGHHQSGIQAYYPLYLLLAAIFIRIATIAFLRPTAEMQANVPIVSTQPQQAELKRKSIWLKQAMKTNCYYQDPELTLSSLAEKLAIHPHELSRIINTALKKNFNDFVNEYRVGEVARKMHDTAHDRLTLLGIAYDSGFNSKATFNRTFREMTGKSPAEYKAELKKERSTYHLRPFSNSPAIISYQQTTPQWSHEKLNRNVMFKNYLKVAWRTIVRNKAHSLINISGLAVGIACSLLILLWVQNELSIDAWHKNGPQIFGVYERSYTDHKAEAGYGTPAHLADEMKKVIPEVQYTTQMDWGTQNTFKVGEKIAKLKGFFAGADYFKMFDGPLLQGSAQAALSTPASMAISRKMANQFYGSPQAAIGKSIRFENQKSFIVSAVFEDLPKMSSQKFDYLINWQEFLTENSWTNDWGNSGPRTFIMLRADANAALVENKITHFLDTYDKKQKKGVRTVNLGLQSYNETYLHGNFTGDKIDGGRIDYVNLFSIVAVFILLIACINFMNLSTARSVKRAREIGVRKVIGAVRSVLIKQFIGESMLVTVIAVAFSLVLLMLLLPVFNQVTQKEIDLPFGEPAFWTRLLVITLTTGLVSGIYPALFLSSFNPVKVLKGTFRIGSGVALFRKGLVVFQFVLSIVLIISTIIISKQVNFIQAKNLGYDRENLIYMPLDGNLNTGYDILKNEALKQPGIQSITRISQTPTNIENGTSGVDWIGKNPNDKIQFTQASVGYDFVKTMKLKLLAGRDYSKDFITDSTGYLINEAALARIGYKDPVGKPLTFWRKKGTIIGVIKDFHFNSLHEQIKPLVIRLGEKDQYGSALIRTQPGQTKQALANLENICKQLNPSFPFNYTFSDEEYQNLYQNEQVIGKLSNAFAFLAIFISCLGLLGLAMFTTEQRFKEIGIRKVLGASVGTLFATLSKEFILLVIIALLIASPLAYWGMTKWLTNYQYKTELSWWIFVLSAVIALFITLVTVSFQTLKASMINPIKSLRSE